MADKYALCQGCGEKTLAKELMLYDVWKLGSMFMFLCKKCRTKKARKKAYEKWRKEAHKRFTSFEDIELKEKNSDVEKHRQAAIDTLNEVWGEGTFK